MDATVVRKGIFGTDTRPLENDGFPAKRMTLFEMTGLRDGLPDTVGGCLNDLADTHTIAQRETTQRQFCLKLLTICQQDSLSFFL